MYYEKSYREMLQYETFLDRFEYLSLKGRTFDETFGNDRYLNQRFYKSLEWRQIRNRVIARDNGCDLGIPGREIHGKILVHHINPIDAIDIAHGEFLLFDENNLITVSHDTHNAIHYGDASTLATDPKERRPGDTKLW